MANASMIVATNDPIGPDLPITPSRSNAAVDSPYKERKQAGPSFAESLEKAAHKNAEAETAGRIETKSGKGSQKAGSRKAGEKFATASSPKAQAVKTPGAVIVGTRASKHAIASSVNGPEQSSSMTAIEDEAEVGAENSINLQADEVKIAAVAIKTLSAKNLPAQESGAAKDRKSDTKKPAAAGKIGDSRKSGVDVKTALQSENKGNTADLSGRAPRVEVVDNRFSQDPMTQDQKDTVEKIQASAGKALSAKRSSAAAGARVFSQTSTGSEIENVSALSVESEIDIDLSPTGKGAQKNAAAELARKLDAQAGSDIVKQVKVILNRSDAGEVRINLRPDNLGRVRVRIRMEDNRLTGRIFVETAAAREAFRSALDGLQAKLVESGFGAADLELAWDESSSSFADMNGRNSGSSARSDEAADQFENMVPTIAGESAGDGRVNLVV